jgi:predicted O-methyltransferase YrrM
MHDESKVNRLRALTTYARRTWSVVRRDPVYLPRVAWALVRDPVEGRERIAERLDEWRTARVPRPVYDPAPNWEAVVHRGLGAAWPCRACADFASLWPSVLSTLSARGLGVGRGAYGGWDDADPALARLVWCATLHLRPEVVVETGVGRGITSRCILEALQRNGHGRLWSVDVPPLLESRYRAETAAAVPEALQSRWTYVAGSSRRRLRGLLRLVGHVDLFVHDSMHTDRNVRFELSEVWLALPLGGVIVADDIERSGAFAAFVEARGVRVHGVVGRADDGRATLGVAIKR